MEDFSADEMEESKPQMLTSIEVEGNPNLDNCTESYLLQKQPETENENYKESIVGEFIENETNGEEHDDTCQEEKDKVIEKGTIDMKKERIADDILDKPNNKRCRINEELNGSFMHGGGQVDVNHVICRVGEYKQKLVQMWKEYILLQDDDTCEGSQNGPTLEIQIPAKLVKSTNLQVKNGRLWGTDVYTVDSDLVAVLMHTGYCCRNASPPSSATEELRAIVRVLAPQDCYISSVRNNVHSRAWRAPIDCSYRVESCCFVKQGGEIIDLEPRLKHSSFMEPTFAPVFPKRKTITRAATLKALARKRFLSSMRFQFNFCMEPWYEYSINIVADQGLKASLYTSARLKNGEVLYVETPFCRYELCHDGEKVIMDSEGSVVDVYRWSRCKRHLTQIHMLSIGIPLPLEYVEVLEENLDWEDISWSHTGVFIAGREYHLARVLFLCPNQ